MANVFIEESTMQAIGAAIRAKTGKSDLILPVHMPTEIENIQVGENPYEPELETKTTSGKIIQLHEPAAQGLPIEVTTEGNATAIFICGRNWCPKNELTITHYTSYDLPMVYPPGQYTFRADVEFITESTSTYCLIQLRTGGTGGTAVKTLYAYVNGNVMTTNISSSFDAMVIYAGTSASAASGKTVKLSNMIMTYEDATLASVYEPYVGQVYSLPASNLTMKQNYLYAFTNDYENILINMEYKINHQKLIAQDDFWSSYQQNGKRTNYYYGFGGYGWTNSTFKPKYNINVDTAYMMFRYSQITGNLSDILTNLNIELNLSQCSSAQYMFSNTQFTRLGKLDFSSVLTTSSTAGNLSYIFAYSGNTLKTIDELHFNPDAVLHSTIFTSCSGLNNIGYTETDAEGNYVLGGVSGIGSDAITLTGCPNLTKHSLLNILNGLVDYSYDSTITKTLKIGAANKARLTDSEIAELAGSKGWNIIT